MRKRQDAAALEDRDKPYVCDSECLVWGGGHPGWGGHVGMNGVQWDPVGSMGLNAINGNNGVQWG